MRPSLVTLPKNSHQTVYNSLFSLSIYYLPTSTVSHNETPTHRAGISNLFTAIQYLTLSTHLLNEC